MPSTSKSADFAATVIELGKLFADERDRVLRLAPTARDLYARRKLHNPNLTFLQFCREVDPTIPEHAATAKGKVRGYLNHPTYRVLDYMRRLTTDLRHRYKECAWDPEHCDTCGEHKDDHPYGDVVAERIR